MMSEAIENDLRGKGSPNQAKNHPSLKMETWRRSSGVNEGGRISGGALKISKTKDEESERSGSLDEFSALSIAFRPPPQFSFQVVMTTTWRRRRNAPMTQQQQSAL